MFRSSLLVALAALLVALAGCRTNQLHIYANDTMTLQVVESFSSGTRPFVGTASTADPANPAEVAFESMSDVVAVGVQQRLEALAPLERLAPVVRTRVAEGVPKYLHNTTVGDTDPKGRLEIVVRSYGVDATGGDVAGFMQVSARLVHFAVGSTIWETNEYVRLPVRTVPGLVSLNPGAELVSLAVLSGFTDAQWQQLMDQLCLAAGDAVVERLRLDSVRG